jgi:hypothetical protein
VAGEVANPDYAELVEVLADVRDYQRLNANVLRMPAQLMGTGGAWTGPSTANVFAAEVQGRHTGLPGRFEALVDAVEHEMARVPSTVPRQG